MRIAQAISALAFLTVQIATVCPASAAGTRALTLLPIEDRALAVACSRRTQLHVDRAVSVGAYGLCDYRPDPPTGPGDNPMEAIYRFKGGRWLYAGIHTAGEFNATALAAYGVPVAIAPALAQKRDLVQRLKRS